jgi:hypothetical protein
MSHQRTDLVRRLNAHVDLESLAGDIDEIGYPEIP